MGQSSLAFLAAATHGRNTEALELKDELEAKKQHVPPVDAKASLIIPPPPISRVFHYIEFPSWPISADD